MATRLYSALFAGAVATTAVLGSTVLTAESASGFTIFTDRNAWRTASGFTGSGVFDLAEDFDGPNIGQSDKITFASGITSELMPNSASPSFNNKVTGDEYSGKTDATTTIQWVFPDLISAFGFDIQGAGKNSGATITGFFNGTDQPEVLINIEEVFAPQDLKPNDYAFFGVVGMGFFDSFTFGSPATNNFKIDNVEAVPTPALLPGLFGFGMSILRKRRKQQESLLATA